MVVLPTAMQAQNISVTSANGQNIATFIHNNLVGNGVYVWNEKFQNATGNVGKPQIGTFNSNGYQLLQMDEGVIMTTGNVDVAPGPNQSSSQTNAVSSYYTDNTISSYATNTLYGCSTVDFDFVSISPYITMNYCFASEEYPEYVCASVNDVFVFLVTGPDPSTGQSVTKNIAIIPHTVSSSAPNGIAVAINSVNQGVAGTNGGSGTGCYYTYSDFYVANHMSGAGGAPNQQPGVQYDGFTQKLSANATLVPCAQYHMHISICNVGDNSYDSGVFLEKNSFNSPSADVNLSHRYADTIERSQSEQMPLTLEGSMYTYGRVTAHFGGTAVIDTDYTVVTDSNRTLNPENNVFYVDQYPHWLTIQGKPDADLTESKDIVIYLATSLCENHLELQTYDTIRYVLREDDVLRLRDTTITAFDTCREVGVEVAIGQPPYTFRWIPEDDIDFPRQQYSSAHITESRLYRVAVADAKGHVDTADVTIDVQSTEGIEEQPQMEMDVQIYPNPADEEINIDADGITLVEVYDVNGRRVFARRCADDCGTVNIRPLPAGLYTVRVTTNLGIKTEKVVVR